MLVTIALGGMFLLFALAAVAGLVDSRSQQSAWRSIAGARHEIFEDRRAIDEQTVELDVREARLEALERAVRLREDAVEARERRLGDAEGPPPAAA